MGTWIQSPHDDASGPSDFLLHVRRGIKRAGDAMYDADADMPWDIDPCKYHLHTTTTRCKPLAADTTSLLSQRTVLGGAKASGLQTASLPIGGQRQYQCRECGMAFLLSGSLQSHKTTAAHKEKAKAWAAKAGQLLGI